MLATPITFVPGCSSMQNYEWIRHSIAGAEQLFEWFGYWPDFHDAELVELQLSRTDASWLKLHAFDMTSNILVRRDIFY